MRRYDRSLLILSIIDFAPAAPILVREERQAHADVVQIPKDVIADSCVGEAGDEDLAKLAEGYLETGEKSTESSDTHASSSSAPPVTDHGPTNAMEASAPNPADFYDLIDFMPPWP
jgi:hypothetical protein